MRSFAQEQVRAWVPCLSGDRPGLPQARHNLLILTEVRIPVGSYEPNGWEVPPQDRVKGPNRVTLTGSRQGNERDLSSFSPIKGILLEGSSRVASKEASKPTSGSSSSTPCIHLGVVEGKGLGENIPERFPYQTPRITLQETETPLIEESRLRRKGNQDGIRGD